MDAAVIASLLKQQTQELLRENAAVVDRAVADAEKRLTQKLDSRIDKIEGAVEKVWDKYRALERSQIDLQEEVLSLKKAVEELGPHRERPLVPAVVPEWVEGDLPSYSEDGEPASNRLRLGQV